MQIFAIRKINKKSHAVNYVTEEECDIFEVYNHTPEH